MLFEIAITIIIKILLNFYKVEFKYCKMTFDLLGFPSGPL